MKLVETKTNERVPQWFQSLLSHDVACWLNFDLTFMIHTIHLKENNYHNHVVCSDCDI